MAGKDRVGADLLYLAGPEPDFAWRTFIEAVVGITGRLGVSTVVGLGAFHAPTPHTRPVRLASTVPPQSADLAGRVEHHVPGQPSDFARAQSGLDREQHN